jgi:hypothetical protein
LLAHFGELTDLKPKPLPGPLVEKLKHLRTRRAGVLDMLLLERSNLAEAPGCLRADIQRHINFLEQSIATLNQEFNRTVRSSAAWR